MDLKPLTLHDVVAVGVVGVVPSERSTRTQSLSPGFQSFFEIVALNVWSFATVCMPIVSMLGASQAGLASFDELIATASYEAQLLSWKSG